jgi:demethylmenaquinone methyltransferase / 2-methoxy-6-polyprenyl-1,4-benzoquinol methylase
MESVAFLSSVEDLSMAGNDEKAIRVRRMFGAIAGRYDFLNHFLSANIDRSWRRTCVREVGKRLSTSAPVILDVGCGTADLSLAFSNLGPVLGCDFCQPMLRVGAEKLKERKKANPISLLNADALALPFCCESFDAAVSAFVLRNLADMELGIREMRRVLRPGGVAGILEFGMPKIPLLAALYRFYFLHILPRLGKVLSGVDGPYGYLPSSVQSFPPAGELKEMIERAGFRNVEYKLLTGGVAVLLVGVVNDKWKMENGK